MKRMTAVTLAFILYALSMPFTACAVDAPHYDPAQGFTCATCHTGHITLGSTGSAGYNNLCLSCHRPGNPTAGKNPFTPADAADPFGIHSTVGPARPQQTSHRWDGSDIVPQAGAQPPIQAALTSNHLRAYSNFGLTCVRCHNSHLNTYGNFLRIPNTQDQLCLDCHRTRNVSSHLQGSHPVTVNYDSVAAAKPGRFNRPPVNTNPGNPTSNLDLQLTKTNRILLCSTCHGVHYTDSRSSTVDGRDNFASLSSGDGYLLRSDRRGVRKAVGQADSSNLCTNCHAGKKNHNQRGQDIQCSDCHGAHVEYDPTDPSSSKGTNVYLIRRNVKKAGQASQVFFRYTGSQREYVNPQGSGVCQGCHDVPPPGGNYPPQHASSDPRVCNSCHFHNNVNGSFSGACISCHGYPPTTGGHTRHATFTAGNLGLNCVSCHGTISTGTHPNSSVNWDLTALGAGAQYKTPTGTFSQIGSTNTPAPSSTYGQCGNIYCHSKGTSLSAPFTAATVAPNLAPIWGGGTLGCGGCHDGSATGPGYTNGTPKPNSHQAHVTANGIACSSCHGTVVSGTGAIIDAKLHANKTYDIAAGGTAGFTLDNIPSPTVAARCANISCHGGNSAVWGGSLGCRDCHAGPGDNNVFALPFSAASPVAVINSAEWSTSGHGRTSGSYLSGNPAAGFSGTNQCLYCHDTTVGHNVPANAFRLVNYSSEAFGRNAPCMVCHSQSGSSSVLGKTSTRKVSSSHFGAKHGNADNGGYFCWDCHDPHGDSNIFMIQAKAAKTSSHSSGAPTSEVPVLFTSFATGSDYAGSAVSICNACHTKTNHYNDANPSDGHNITTRCTSCHSHDGSGPLDAFMQSGSSCDACHGYPPAAPGFVGAGNAWPAAREENYLGGGGAHTINNHVSSQARPGEGFANCLNCHNPADHAMSPIVFRPSQNIKAAVKQSLRSRPGIQARYSSNRLDSLSHQTGTCTNISCHFGATPKWDPNH